MSKIRGEYQAALLRSPHPALRIDWYGVPADKDRTRIDCHGVTATKLRCIRLARGYSGHRIVRLGGYSEALFRGEARHSTPGVTVAGGAILTNLRSIFQTGARLFRTKAGSRLAKIG